VDSTRSRPGDPVTARTSQIARTEGGTSIPKRSLSGHVSEGRASAEGQMGSSKEWSLTDSQPASWPERRIGPGRHPRRRVARRRRHRRSAGGARRDGKSGHCRDAEWQQHRRLLAPQLEPLGWRRGCGHGLGRDVDREKRASGPRYPAPAGARRRPPSAKAAQHYATAAQHSGHRALPTLTRNSLPETGDSARRASRGAEVRDWARSPGSVPAYGFHDGSHRNDPIGHLK
jgi:hypothetical protein